MKKREKFIQVETYWTIQYLRAKILHDWHKTHEVQRFFFKQPFICDGDVDMILTMDSKISIRDKKKAPKPSNRGLQKLP